MKKKNLALTLGLICSLSLACVGCGSNAAAETTDIAETGAALADSVVEATTTEAKTENTLLYGTVNLPYADFYYGELNNIEPELDATVGQYDVEDVASAAGYEEEGMYDAVTSATTNKSKKFAASYYEEVETGVNILGASNVNVAISSALYEDVQNAIAAGTDCKNPLVELVSNMTLTEEVPVEYKVINSDGTVSKTIGNTVTAENVTATITTISSWGDYQIDFEGLELDAAAVQGAILETSDGALYGLEHEDNLWLQAAELSFAVAPFTESHGNEVAYQRFADIPGKTITKVTYLVANGDDVAIETNLYCNLQLTGEYGVSGDETVTYASEGTVVNIALKTPTDSAYSLSQVKKGRSAVDASTITYADEVLTLPADCTPGSYKIIFEDATYCGLQHMVTVESGLSDGDVSFDGATIQLAGNTGLTGSAYIANISAAYVNGEKLSGKNVGSTLFTEDGSFNFEATTKKDDAEVELFPAGATYEISLESTGFPAVTFEITR